MSFLNKLNHVIDDNDVLVPMSQVPRYLPISLQYAYDLVKNKILPAVKIGGKLFVKENVLLKIKECGTAPYTSVEKELV
jgi:hypothetical protein